MTELKSCGCQKGSEPVILPGGKGFILKCHCCGREITANTIDRAIAKWNKEKRHARIEAVQMRRQSKHYI